MAHLFKKLDKAALTSNPEIQCLKESLAGKAVYLETKYSLFDNSPESKLLLKDAVHEVIANNKIQQKVQEDCLSIYLLYVAFCQVFYQSGSYGTYNDCMQLADAALLFCLGIP